MTPDEFVTSTPGFSKLRPTDQIRHFCWYLTRRREIEEFQGADVLRCFEAANCPPPSSVGPFLVNLAKRSPPFLIRRKRGYVLSRDGAESLDRSLGWREASVAVDDLLVVLPDKIALTCERVYLEETLACFRCGAFRATVVMAWNLAFDHLCNFLLNHHQQAFNTQLAKSFPKADIQVVNERDDFSRLKEFQVIQVAKSAGIVSNSLNKVLREKLDRRNVAAHPSGVAISKLTAEEFVLDLVENVVLKLS